MFKGLGIIDEEALNIFTDGSSFPKKKRAAGVGIRFVWVNKEGDEVCEDYAPPGWKSCTVDEMEIKAVTTGLKEAKRIFSNLSRFQRILVYSDSQYVVDNFFRAIKIWPNQKWLGSNKIPVSNISLWKELRKEVNNCPIRVDVKWVKGHKKNIHNRAADKLAKQSASEPLNAPITMSETTKKWSERTTIRGCVPVKGQIIKIRIVSRECIPRAKIERYRYEVIDPNDSNFQDLDFVYCKTNLSRNKCYEVRLNDDHSKPTIVKILCELNCADFKYS
ncbi:MAG: hypothetical protein HF981_00555 [Desulfobacteraceae bacterium]|nr:hypothetical protein [Desulfobacteraceae bacterium]MBC2748859.1 hypothetical protein [Desulfobacteraceae bacterium]